MGNGRLPFGLNNPGPTVAVEESWGMEFGAMIFQLSGSTVRFVVLYSLGLTGFRLQKSKVRASAVLVGGFPGTLQEQDTRHI